MRSALAAVFVLVVACSNGAAQATPRPPAAATPAPLATPVRLHPPAEAVLEDAEVGLPRVSGRDHLSAAEAASGAADQPLALQTYTSWGWSEESTRSWKAEDRSADALVLLTLRSSGARIAFAYYAQQTDVAPYAGRPCTADLASLDGCHVGVDGSRVVVTGWLAEEVFVVGGTGIDVYLLAAKQAQRLRA